MAQPQDALNYAVRRFVVDGVASSGENLPNKPDMMIFGGVLQGALTSLINGIVIGGAVVYSTRALLFADLVHAAGVLGVVYADSTQAYNGVYVKAGSSGSGSWSITNLALPSTFSTDLATVTAGLAAHVGTGGTVHPVATTSVAGFESAADKTKLDGIAALADVTAAANVGTVIHGVTGKTTPVDADELGLIDSAASNVLKKLTWANLKAALWTAWGALIAAGTTKATPVDGDLIAIADSAASNATKTLSWANLKATLKTYLDTLYQPLNGALTSWVAKAIPSGTVVGTSDTQTLTNKTLTSPTINGGTFTGGTDIAVADGGTGASTASAARTNLGLDTMATQAASAVAITGGTVAGITDIALADGGTGASTASGARTNLGLAVGADVQAFSGVLGFLATASAGTAAAVKTLLALVKADVGLGNVDNTSDANKPISSAETTALAGKQAASAVLTFLATASAGTAAAVKTLLGLVKADVGLGSVDNTSDTGKPVSTAQATAIALKEALANKATNLTSPDDTKYPSTKAVSDALALKGAASDVALLQSQQADFVGAARNHPGDVPTLLTAGLTGAASGRTPLAVGAPAVSDYFGAAWQVDAAAIALLPGSPGFVDVALRMDMPLNAAGKYLIYWGLERAVDPVDPEGEGVELRIQNLSKTKAAISNIVFGDLGGGAFGAGGPAFSPTVAGGPIERGLVISRASGSDVDYQVPSTTRYVTVMVRIYGATGKTNIGRISFDDVSLAKTIAGSAAAVQANLDVEAATRASADSTLTSNKADKTTTLTAAGLATGGGSLAANRTITVPAAVVTDLNDGVAVAASALLSVTPAALATLYGQHADLVASYAAKVFSTYKGFAAISPQGHIRPIINEYGEADLTYPWPLRFGGLQVFPDQNGKGLGVIDPDAGTIAGLRIRGVNHKAFGWGYGPTDDVGNYAWYVDPLTGIRYDRDTATTSSYYQFAADNEDHGGNVGLLDVNTGASALLTYDEGDATIVSVSATIARVVTHSTYQLGVYPSDPIAANKGVSPDDLTVHPAGYVQSRDISLTPVSMGLGTGRTKLKFYPGRGQSDWNGTKGTPVLTTSAVATGIAKMFVGGAQTAQNPGGWYDRMPDSAFASIVDLKEGTNPSGGLESPMSGLAAHLVPALASDTAILLATTAVSGYDYDLQGRGTWPFDAARRACLEHIRHCLLNGIAPVFGAVTMSWGSSDNLEGMSQANFRTRLIAEQVYWTRLKNELYNQPGEALLYFNIGTGWPEWAGNPTTFRAFWELSKEFSTKFRVVASDQCRAEIPRAGPGAGDPAYVHYNNEGNRRNGETTGYGIVRDEAGLTCCVAVIGATPVFASSYVDVLVSLMNGSLTSDTGLVSDPGNLGMYWTQTGGTVRTLSSAAIQNANNGDGTATVRLTLSGNPGAPSYWEVGALYGQTVSSRPDGPRSPLRDASSFLALDGVTTIHPGWIVPSYYPSTGW